MFRLTAYDDQPELYRYLSSIASNSICRALDDWFGTPYELEEVYLDYFTSRIGVNRRTDFFNGMENTFILMNPAGRMPKNSPPGLRNGILKRTILLTIWQA